jgi:hypothetical protein
MRMVARLKANHLGSASGILVIPAPYRRRLSLPVDNMASKLTIQKD